MTPLLSCDLGAKPSGPAVSFVHDTLLDDVKVVDPVNVVSFRPVESAWVDVGGLVTREVPLP